MTKEGYIFIVVLFVLIAIPLTTIVIVEMLSDILDFISRKKDELKKRRERRDE